MRTLRLIQSVRFLFVLFVISPLAYGCSTFSTAASMRVDVKVYKGPLTKSETMQKQELIALVHTIELGLKNFKEFVDDPEFKQKLKDDFIEDDPVRRLLVSNFDTTLKELIKDCKDISNQNKPSLTKKMEDSRGKTNGNSLHFDNEFLSYFIKVSKLANSLKTHAFYWGSHSTFASHPRMVRFFITDFVNMASQFSNQIDSRIHALEKLNLYRRGELPLSDYLRDTSPTDFVNLYSWNRASDLEIWENYLLHPIQSFSSESTDDRIRTFEHLFADQYWSNINTVYASGQGDVNMAFVKDEIGNWTLKSFDADPTEIVQAYKNLTVTALKKAAEITASASTGGATTMVSPNTLNTISKLTSGNLNDQTQSDPVLESKVAALKDQTVLKLNVLKSNTNKDATVTGARKLLTEYKDELDKLQSLKGPAIPGNP